MGTWKTDELENCLSAIIDYRGKTPAKSSSGVPLITAKIVKNGCIESPNEFIAEEDYQLWMTRGLPRKGDVILTTEAPLGEVAQISDERVALAQRIILLRGNNFLDNGFLKYYLISDFGQSELLARQSGTTVLGIKQSELRKIKIRFPSFDEQKAIARILSSPDDKIELNRRMNATLEAMARALFKAWFVDFEPVHANKENRPSTSASPEVAKLFPSEFENGIPKSWQYIKLEELIDTISVTHKFPKDKIVFLNTSDISNGYVLTHKHSDVEGLPGQAKKSIKKHDILYSEIRPANKRFAYIDFEADNYVVSTKLMVLRAKSFIDPVFIYYFLKSDETVAHLQMLAESRSGTFPQITFDQLKRLEFLVPNPEILQEYTRFLKGIFEKSNLNVRQNEQLAEIRDTLLPRLISGKLAVRS